MELLNTDCSTLTGYTTAAYGTGLSPDVVTKDSRSAWHVKVTTPPTVSYNGSDVAKDTPPLNLTGIFTLTATFRVDAHNVIGTVTNNNFTGEPYFDIENEDLGMSIAVNFMDSGIYAFTGTDATGHFDKLTSTTCTAGNWETWKFVFNTTSKTYSMFRSVDGGVTFTEEVTDSTSYKTEPQYNGRVHFGCDVLGEYSNEAWCDSIIVDTTTQELYNSGLFTDANAVAYYQFENNLTDSIGTNNLTGYNSPTYGTGVFNKCVNWNSAIERSAYIADNPALSITGTISITGWMKLAQLPSVDTIAYGIVTKTNSGTNDRSYSLLLDTEDKLSFKYSSDGTNNNTLTKRTSSAFVTSNELDTGRWIFFAVTVTPSTGEILFYKDGLSKASETIEDVGTHTSIYNGTAEFVLGASNNHTGAFFNGSFDDIYVSNRILTPIEIENLYNGYFGSPSVSPSISPSFSISPSSSISPSASQSPSSSESESISPSPSESPSASFSPSSSVSPSVSPSASISPSGSLSPSASASASVSASVSPSSSASSSASMSISPSSSVSPSPSSSLSPSGSASRSVSPSASISPSLSQSYSASVSRSISPSASASPSASISPSHSISPSASPSPHAEVLSIDYVNICFSTGYNDIYVVKGTSYQNRYIVQGTNFTENLYVTQNTTFVNEYEPPCQ